MNSDNQDNWIERFKDSRYGRRLKKLWTKYWEIIIAAIVGFIVSGIFLPLVFR